MTPHDTGESRRRTAAAEPEPGVHDLARPPAGEAQPDRHGRHAVIAVAVTAGQVAGTPELDLGDDSWQREEIESDRRRERRLVWQSLAALAVVAALVVAGRVLG